jgi:hypothetical protein
MVIARVTGSPILYRNSSILSTDNASLPTQKVRRCTKVEQIEPEEQCPERNWGEEEKWRKVL